MRPPGQKRKRKGVIPALDLHGMPDKVPELPPAQYSLPEALGRLYDSTILSSDSLRPLGDYWCSFAIGKLLCAGAIIRPLRAATDTLLQSPSVAQQQPAVDDVSESGSIGSESDDESGPD